MVILEPKLARIRALARKRSTIYGVTDTLGMQALVARQEAGRFQAPIKL